MKTYYLPADYALLPSASRSVALGIFDGLHAGHRRVILAAGDSAPDGVVHSIYTFVPSAVTTKKTSGRLCTAAEQEKLLEGLGIDELIVADFGDVQDLPPQAFVTDVLHDRLHAVQVSCGYNYRFGKDGAGDARLLKELCAACGIAVQIVEEVTVDGHAVNSTAIRQSVAAGDMPAVRRMLNRGYSLTLPVEQGQHLGRRLGMPTINQTLPADLVRPRFGVYASYVEIGSTLFPAVTNIGVRPTVGSENPLAETWIQGFSGNLYGAVPTVYPLQFLRPERPFANLDALKAQMQQDGAAAASLFFEQHPQPIRAILFDFDDTLHDRDASLRRGLEAFLDYYFPLITKEEKVSRREAMFSHNRQHCNYPLMVAHFLHEWGADNVDTAQALRRFYTLFAASCPMREDVLPTLQALRKAGYLLGVITNGESFLQNRKLDYSGLRPYIDLCIAAGDELVQKPDPLLFRRAAARLGLPAAACVFVGDNPIDDIEGAAAAGMRPVYLEVPRSEDSPFRTMKAAADVPVIHRIGELPDCVAALDLCPKMQ